MNGDGFSYNRFSGRVYCHLMIVDSLIPVLVELTLHLPNLFTGVFRVVSKALESGDRMCPLLYADGFEGVEAVFVVNLQDESWQSAELPRSAFHWDVRSEPSFEVTSTETASRFLALIADDGLRLVR